MRRTTWFSLFLVMVSGLASEDLPAFLKDRVLPEETTLGEVQNFIEARLPRMPAVQNPEEWRQKAAQIRKDVLDKVVFRGEAAKWRDLPTKVEWLGEIEGGPGYTIKKLRYEAVPGLWIPGLLYEPANLQGKVPVIMNVNGHDGNGKAAVYKQIRCINLAKRGMVVLNLEWIGMGQLRGENFAHYRMNQLDLCGTSGLAPFYLAMKRGLDILLELPNADPARVGVSGLSGGGWQTIFISSLDERVTLSNPVAGYSSFFTRARHFEDLGDSEQTPSDLAVHADYTHLTALRAPRPTLLTYNAKDDCCFATPHALPPLVEAARPVFELLGKGQALRTHNNFDPGTHNFEKDNRQQFYRMVGDFFFPEQKDFSWEEIESTAEVKTKEQLEVPLPPENGDFQKLALRLCEGLPGNAESSPNGGTRELGREKLRALLRVKHYNVQAEQVRQQTIGDVQATLWRMRLGSDWTVPALVLQRGNPTETLLTLSESGLADRAPELQAKVSENTRVVAFDPFYFGQCKIKARDFLFGLLVAATGERPLGIQTSQVAAVSRWASHQFGTAIKIEAAGPRLGTICTIAAALEPKAARLEVKDGIASLREVIQKNWAVNEKPELFAFGLLKEFDLPQIQALAHRESR